MPHIIDRLAALRVSEVMANHVVSVGKNQTMSEVALLLAKHELSSAPVVDELDHCVGVVTATDFLKREGKLRALTEDAASAGQLPPGDASQEHRCVPLGEDFVSYHMSTAVQSIDPGASLLRAARIMCAEHIHRLFVIDTQNHPVGVLSTMDIVAATVNVADQIQSQAGTNNA